MTFKVGDKVRVIGHDESGFGHAFEVGEVGTVRDIDPYDGSLDVEVENDDNPDGFYQWVAVSEVESLDNVRLKNFRMLHADSPEMPFWVQRQDEDAVALLAEEHPANIYYADEES
jgi:hypothetical protein